MMKKQLLTASAALFSIAAAHAGGEGWTHDFEAAQKQAAKEGKDLLIDFTGSDWCSWCIKLRDEVFTFDTFKEGVADQYVLVELDFPRTEEGLAKLSDETKEQNEKLQQKYQIQGFPTILLTDAQGRPYAQTGYQPGGPEAYLTHLEELQENKKARDKAFDKAEDLEGLAKAEALFKGLQAVPEDYRIHYEGVIETIKKNDPNDTTGLIATQEMQKAMIELERGLQTAMRAQQPEKAMKLVDEFISTQKPEGEEKQKLLAIKLNILLSKKEYDKMDPVIEEIIAVDPDSEYARGVAGFRDTRLPQLKKEAEEN